MSEQSQQQEVLLTAIPDLSEVHVSRPNSEEHDILYLKDRQRTDAMATALGQLFSTLEPGNYNKFRVYEETEVHPSTMLSIVRRVASAGRPDVLSYRQHNTRVHLGNVAVAMRKATPEELESLRKTNQQIVSEASKKLMQEMLAADPEKTDLTTMDHAVIIVDQERYFLGLDAAESILLARIAEVHADFPAGKGFYGRDFGRAVWQSMHTSERKLFARTDLQAFVKPPKFNDIVERYVRTAGADMKLSYYQNGDSFTRRSTDVRVEYSDQLPQGPLRARPLVPFVGLRTPLEQMSGPQHTEEMIVEMAALYERIIDSALPKISVRDAHDVLYRVMLREGKVALAAALGRREEGESVDDAIDLVHQYVKRILGHSGYVHARSQNIINGFTYSNKRMMHQTGRRNLAAVKWYIGTEHDPEGQVEAN